MKLYVIFVSWIQKKKDKSPSDSKIRGNIKLSTFCLYTVYALENY